MHCESTCGVRHRSGQDFLVELMMRHNREKVFLMIKILIIGIVVSVGSSADKAIVVMRVHIFIHFECSHSTNPQQS